MRICRFDDNRLGVVTDKGSMTSHRRSKSFRHGPILCRYSIPLLPTSQSSGRRWRNYRGNPRPNPSMGFACAVRWQAQARLLRLP